MPLKCDSHRDEALLMDADHGTIYSAHNGRNKTISE